MISSRIYGQEQGYKAAEPWLLPSDDGTGLEADAGAGNYPMLRLLSYHGGRC